MVNEYMDSVIVKLGKNESNLLFRDTYMIRAITVRELYSHFEKSNTLVIENVKENEIDNIREAIVAFKERSGDNRVLFYVVDNDLATLNLAEELNCNIYKNLFDIQQEMSYIFKRDVSTYLSRRCEIERLTPTERLLLNAEELISNTDGKTQEILRGLVEEIRLKSSEDNKLVALSKTNIGFDTKELDLVKHEKIELEQKLADKEKVHSVLQNTLNELQDRFNIKVDRLIELENKLKIKEEEAEQLKSETEQLKSETEQLKSETEKLNAEYSILKENNELEITKNRGNEEKNKEKIDELQRNIDELTNSSNELRELNEKALNEKEEIEKEHELEISYLKDEFNAVRKDLVDYAKNAIETYKVVIKEIHERIDTYRENEKSLELEIESFGIKNSNNENTIIELNEKIRELSDKASRTDGLVAQAIKNEQDKMQELIIAKAALDGEVRTLKAELEATKLSYNELLNSGASITGMKALQDNNQMLNDLVKTLREQISTQKIELDKTIKEKGFISSIKDELEQKVQSLNRSLRTMTEGMMNGGNAELPPCNYSGRGLIIPVIGSGSHGITTTAMSLANKLAMTSKVLFIDFDLVLPTADSWFNKNPIIKNAPGFDQNNYSKYTGLGLFIDKQSDYFTHNANTLIQRVKDTKEGYLDYLSGIYTKPDTIKLISANYTSFFNYCGNSYQYIIIDCGRFGSSDLNDQLIKLMTNIAYRTVVVTTPDKFEIRTFRIKLTEAKIDVSNICWLINLCKNTSLDKAVKGYISPAEIGMLPECFELFGEKQLFSSQRITRDKFNVFFNTIFGTSGLK